MTYIDKKVALTIVKEIYPEADTYEHRNQISIIVPREEIVEVCRTLRDHPESQFDMLLDITAIDWLDKRADRFEIVYFLYSTKLKHRLRLKVAVSELDIHCPTMTDVWRSANWYERETFDMYGIIFDNHPRLRRFYMPEDYLDPETGEPLHPMRKDFPLMGIPDSLPLPPYPEKYGKVK